MTREGRLKLVNKMREIALHYVCIGKDLTVHDAYRLATTNPVSMMLKDMPKLRYFYNGGKWFEDTTSLALGLADVCDMYSGWYTPDFKERVRNIKNWIASHVHKF